MKEVWRSFEGKLDGVTQHGHIVYEIEGMYEIHEMDVYSGGAHKFRIAKDYCKDYKDLEYLAIVEQNVFHGHHDRQDMQVMYDGKWWSGKKICEIIEENNGDRDWLKKVR